jgi:DnaJ-class molecular chaperone
VAPKASEAEIKAAFRTLAKTCHPDLKPGDKEAASRFQMIQASYDVLRRAEERRASLLP